MRIKKLAVTMGIMLAGAAIGPAALAQTSNMPSQSQNATSQNNMAQQHQQWQKMDSNQDGHVSKTEFDTYWKQQFKSADTNSDGKLSKQELMAAVNKMNGDKEVDQTRFDQMWQKMASNGGDNDSISQQDCMAYHDKMFRQADSNHDSMLSKAEVHDAMRMHEDGVAAL